MITLKKEEVYFLIDLYKKIAFSGVNQLCLNLNIFDILVDKDVKCSKIVTFKVKLIGKS
jgi:hypothetical protein